MPVVKLIVYKLTMVCSPFDSYESGPTTVNRVCSRNGSRVGPELIAGGHAAGETVERGSGTVRLVQSTGPTGQGLRSYHSPPILERLSINEANWISILQKLIGPTWTCPLYDKSENSSATVENSTMKSSPP